MSWRNVRTGVRAVAKLNPAERDRSVGKGALLRPDQRQEPLVLFVGAEAHHPLDTGPVVPRAVEEDDLARRRKVRDVTRDVPRAPSACLSPSSNAPWATAEATVSPTDQ